MTTVVGGSGNESSGNESSILGGSDNIADENRSTVVGEWDRTYFDTSTSGNHVD